MAPQRSDNAACLFHSDTNPAYFDDAIKQLKGSVIPKRILKRTGYLVCICCKKHTSLDDEFHNLQLTSVRDRLLEVLASRCPSPSHSPNLDPEEENCNADVTHHADLSLAGALTDCFHGDAAMLSSSQRRLLVIIAKCLAGDTACLEPRPLQQDKVQQMKKLKRGKFYRKLKPSEKVKYVNESVTLRHPEVTSSALIGKGGRNVRAITGSKDVYVSVRDGARAGEVAVDIRATNAADVEAARRAVYDLHQNVIRTRKAWRARVEQRQYLKDLEDNEAAPFLGKPQFSIDDQKDIAREQFERKSSHQISSGPPVKTRVLDKDSRCVNCLTSYDQTADGNTACKHHPGYINKDNKWTCCTRVYKGGSHTTTTTEGKRQGHSINGCTRSRHNWHLHKKSKCSGRKQKQAAF